MIDIDNWVGAATVVGGFATAFAAAFAVVGIPLAIMQIRASVDPRILRNTLRPSRLKC